MSLMVFSLAVNKAFAGGILASIAGNRILPVQKLPGTVNLVSLQSAARIVMLMGPGYDVMGSRELILVMPE